MTDRPRIDHVIPAPGIGGVEVAAATAANRVDLSCDVRLVFISDARGEMSVITRWLPAALRSLSATAAQVRRDPPDVLLASLWKSVPVLAALRVRRNRPPLVFFLHSAREWHIADRLFSKLGIRLADEVWADSGATLAARAVPAGKPTRIVSFVADQLDAPALRDVDARFVSWGRLHPAKAYDRAIHFIALLVARGINARFDLYGPDAGEGAALRALVASLGLENRVRFLGPVERADLVAAAEGQAFFLQTSRSEGMCMAAVEAMQLGLVPIATAVGEMARYVRPGETGIVLDPDHPEVAAARVAELLVDPAGYRRLSAAAGDHWRAEPSYAQDLCRAAHEAIRDNRHRHRLA